MNKKYLMIILFGLGIAESKPPALFNFNQGTEQAFYFFREVLIDTVNIDNNDWVGLFNCNKWDEDSMSCLVIGACVGARKYDRTRCGGGICDLPAMGSGSESSEITKGYMKSGEYPVFLIYDTSSGLYYSSKAYGDVRLQDDTCRNGYPYCYEWKNKGFLFAEKLVGDNIYMDCKGKIGGKKSVDECGVCGGSGPQYFCDELKLSFCTEYEYIQKCNIEK